jgi:hypothetical protein
MIEHLMALPKKIGGLANAPTRQRANAPTPGRLVLRLFSGIFRAVIAKPQLPEEARQLSLPASAAWIFLVSPGVI